MVQANIDGSVIGTKALLTSAAATEASAQVLGALFDFMSTMRRRHADTAGTSAILTKLAGGGAQRSCDLAERLSLDQSTVSRQVAHLESAGLVERRPMTDDRRAHLVDLTPDGVASAHDLITQRVAFFESVLATWSDEDMQTFATLLARLATGLLTNERNLTEGTSTV